ncbi:ankyrin repeat domain-containing protein [Vibrio campbellii]|uniref:ankyrin repeat domain-containing protein n=1 Tax=Vibrio campbellii TaxID=680 RepID=UPI0005F0922D|nr:ankyrin repeat domain-containing protein [Vibrio campbellii]
MLKKLTAILVVVAATVTVFASSVDDERLVLCALGSNIALFNDSACLTYIETFNLSESYIDSINSELGIMTILNSNHENKFKVADVLLQQGADINSINTLDGLSLPPLHSAVLSDDYESFLYLIDHGARVEALSSQTSESLYDFTDRLLKQNPTPARANMLEFIQRMI